MPVHRTTATSPLGHARPEAASARVPLAQAVPALLARLGDVAAALEGGAAPFPPPGFAAVPDGPPSRRERALLVQFAWTAYTVLAGRPPADTAPAEWPYRLSSLVPLSQRRPDLLPALGRLFDRILTAPPLAPLPSPAGLEELLRRAMPRGDDEPTPIGRTSRPATPPHSRAAGVVVEVDFRPTTPEPPAAVVARLRLLAAVLAGAETRAPLDARRGLFRLGWTGWERLHGEAPYRHDRPYELRLGDTTPIASPRVTPIAVPSALPPLLAVLLAQQIDAEIPSLADVRAALAAMAADDAAQTDHLASSPETVAPPDAVVQATVDEATRVLDALIADGLVRPGAAAATARSLDERLAVTSLAWSVYRAATGTNPVAVDDAEGGGAAPYRPLGDAAPLTPPPLAAVVDATLSPESPASVPGAAAWLAAATQAAEWHAPTDAPRDPTPPAADREHAPRVSDVAAPRRRVQLLPDETLRSSSLPTWAWLVALGLALTVWRLSGGP